MASPSETAATERFIPNFLAVDSEDRVYSTDCQRGRVFRIGEPGALITVVGSGPGGHGNWGGDGGPATEAEIECPNGIAFDAADDLFVVDHSNNRVRRVDSQGVINTVAGSGAVGFNRGSYGGDGLPATEGLLNEPVGIAFDAAGNMYIADRDNHRIRKVDTAGTITTIAGNGVLYPPFGGDDGPATEATLRRPQGIAVDSTGNVYFADSENNRVRMIDPQGRITTVVGTGERASTGDEGMAVEAAIADPSDVLLDDAGNLYVSEAGTAGNRVRRIDADGIIHAFAGIGAVGFSGDGGPAIDATFRAANSGFGLAIDSRGNIYIADAGNGRVRMVGPSGVITTFADGSGTP